MSFSTTMRATLDLGIRGFESGLRQASAKADGFAKELKKKFSDGGIVGTLLSAFAISNIIEGLAAKVAAGISGGSLQGWQRAKDAADAYGDYIEERLKKKLSGEALEKYLERQAASFEAQADSPRMRGKGGLLSQLFGGESSAELLERQETNRLKAAKARDEQAESRRQRIAAEGKESVNFFNSWIAAETALTDARIEAGKRTLSTQDKIRLAMIEIADAQAEVDDSKDNVVEHAQAELELLRKQNELQDLQKQREKEITEEKDKQLAAEKELAAQRERSAAALAQAAAAQARAQQAVLAAQKAFATALSDQSAASLGEVTAGTRGSLADRRRAAEVARLRELARTARDSGASVLLGGQSVAVADQLSSRANQVQAGITSLSSAERDPLASVTAQLVQANQELAEIRQSLAVMEISD